MERYNLKNYQRVQLSPAKQPKRKRRINSNIIVSIVCGAAVFLSSFAYIDLNATLIQEQHDLRAINVAWQQQQSKLNELTSELAKSYNLDIIEDKAINELSMHKPMAHQIVYIDIKEESFVTYAK